MRHLSAVPEPRDPGWERGPACPEVGRRLRLARELTAFTIEEASFRLCASVRLLADLESGTIGPCWFELEKLGRLYGATQEWFLGQVPEQIDDFKANREPEPVRTKLRTILAMRRTQPP